jgi:hypothetical protein
VGVLEPGGELDLAEKALGAEGAGQLGVEHLEGDGAVVAEVLREVDGGHAATSELADQAVTVGQGVAQSVRRLTQAGLRGQGVGCGVDVVSKRRAGVRQQRSHPR